MLYECLHAYVRACIYACVRASMRACVHLCVPACLHACVDACVGACVRVRAVRLCIHTCMCVWVCMVVPTYVRVCICVFYDIRNYLFSSIIGILQKIDIYRGNIFFFGVFQVFPFFFLLEIFKYKLC